MSWEDPRQYKTWETLYLGPHKFPGLASAQCNAVRDIEILRAKDQDSGAIQDNGYVPSNIDITVRYRSDDHDEMRNIITDIHPRTRGPDRAPLEIQLEQVNFLGIEQVYIQDIGTPQISDGIGHLTLQVIEYLDPQEKPDQRPARNTTPEAELPDPAFAAFGGG